MQSELQQNNLSIGMIISLHKQQNKSLNAQSKDQSRAFYPYQPLDLNQQYRNIEKIKSSRVTSDVLDIVDECVDMINKFDKLDKNEQEQIAIAKYDKTQAHTQKHNRNLSPIKENKSYAKEPLDHPQQDFYKQQMLSEMGINEEGMAQARGAERRGLGAMRGDMFDQFRTQRSRKYHVAAEERQRGVKEDLLCYICQQPGHFAKDCKFGID